jgi:hypothetical protein
LRQVFGCRTLFGKTPVLVRWIGPCSSGFADN